jgi:hypothetical protein
MKTTPPLSLRPMTELQARRLFDDIWNAMHPPSGLQPGRVCELCGWPVHPAFRGRNKAHDDELWGTVCGRCNATPPDDWYALAVLMAWDELDDLLGRRATVDEFVAHTGGGR